MSHNILSFLSSLLIFCGLREGPTMKQICVWVISCYSTPQNGYEICVHSQTEQIVEKIMSNLAATDRRLAEEAQRQSLVSVCVLSIFWNVKICAHRVSNESGGGKINLLAMFAMRFAPTKHFGQRCTPGFCNSYETGHLQDGVSWLQLQQFFTIFFFFKFTFSHENSGAIDASCFTRESGQSLLGPVVQSSISANPGLTP